MHLYYWNGLDIFGSYFDEDYNLCSYDGVVVVMAKNVEEARKKIIQKFGYEVERYVIKHDPIIVNSDIIAFYSNNDNIEDCNTPRIIISHEDYLGIFGKCKECGLDVVEYKCTDNLNSKRPESAEWDWWISCTNPQCKHHYGEGIFVQNNLEWVTAENELFNNNKLLNNNEKPKECTMVNTLYYKSCHAFNNGKCMNAFLCKNDEPEILKRSDWNGEENN